MSVARVMTASWPTCGQICSWSGSLSETVSLRGGNHAVNDPRNKGSSARLKDDAMTRSTAPAQTAASAEKDRHKAPYPGRQDWATWPQYDAAVSGFRGYWYPVTWSTHVTSKPSAFTICGEKIALVRDNGTAYALHDRCPHRGVPLSLGNQQFPGTLSCPYHGWTYNLSDGLHGVGGGPRRGAGSCR